MPVCFYGTPLPMLFKKIKLNYGNYLQYYYYYCYLLKFFFSNISFCFDLSFILRHSLLIPTQYCVFADAIRDLFLRYKAQQASCELLILCDNWKWQRRVYTYSSHLSAHSIDICTFGYFLEWLVFAGHLFQLKFIMPLCCTWWTMVIQITRSLFALQKALESGCVTNMKPNGMAHGCDCAFDALYVNPKAIQFVFLIAFDRSSR